MCDEIKLGQSMNVLSDVICLAADQTQIQLGDI